MRLSKCFGEQRMKKAQSNYYTPLNVSKQLLQLIDFKDNSTVIDICCGSGNLLKAAKEINPSIQCYGVDITKVDIEQSFIVNNDGRSFALRNPFKYDYALANPPFGRRDTEKYIKSLFVNEYSRIRTSRIEVEMLIANLLVLKPFGTLLAILPSTLVNGTSMINVRKSLAQNNTILSIVDLPINAFHPERIKCSAIIIKKEKNERDLSTKQFIMNPDCSLVEKNSTCAESIRMGFWDDNHTITTHPSLLICQGKISTNQFCDSGTIVLHTCKKSGNWEPSIRYVKSVEDKYKVIVNSGDILISRVGASAGQKCIYSGSPHIISDCLLLVRSPSESICKNLMSLDLCSLVTGLSTPHITIASINNLYSNTFQI